VALVALTDGDDMIGFFACRLDSVMTTGTTARQISMIDSWNGLPVIGTMTALTIIPGGNVLCRFTRRNLVVMARLAGPHDGTMIHFYHHIPANGGMTIFTEACGRHMCNGFGRGIYLGSIAMTKIALCGRSFKLSLNMTVLAIHLLMLPIKRKARFKMIKLNGLCFKILRAYDKLHQENKTKQHTARFNPMKDIP
jgi:hypothetical protein